jgi:hypothetical protein
MDSIADSSSSAKRIYSPLADSDEIRLLCLQPRVSGGPIKCTIEHIKLSSNTPYEALSYVWGPQEFRTIEINGKLCDVRINLWQALFHLCLETSSRVLWIDALCINQADLNERNHQVTQMGKIYRNASRVVVWLGESDSASSTAMEILQEAGFGNESDEAYWRLLSNHSIDALNNIHSIFLREYWSRLWIVQEVTLAWEVIVQCGSEVIEWDYLDSLVWEIDNVWCPNDQSIPPTRPQRSVSYDRAILIQSLKGSALAKLVRRRSSTKEMLINDFDDLGHSLLHLCSDHGAANCVDPRDKIFGLHALTRKCCADAVPVDYSLSLFQISTRVLSHHRLSHSSPDHIVSESRKLHDALGISSDHIRNETSKAPTAGLTLEKPDQETLFVVHGNHGNCSGRISFINSLSQEATTLNQPPHLSFQIWEHLNMIGRQLKQSPTSRVQITSQLDLVFPIEVHVTYSMGSFRKERKFLLPPTAAISPSEYVTRISFVDEPYSQTDQGYHLYAFQQIVSATQKVVSPHSGLGIKLAFEENGAIILAPSNANVGDILCQFGSADTLAIIRPSRETKNKCHLVGRAVTLYSLPPPPYGSVERWAKFEIDVRILQMLTLASQHPDNAHTFPP